jgi:hypothetical protein
MTALFAIYMVLAMVFLYGGLRLVIERATLTQGQSDPFAVTLMVAALAFVLAIVFALAAASAAGVIS